LAVNDTLWPVVISVAEEDRVVVVATMLCETTTLTVCDTELLSLLSPAYEAVIDCVPTAKAVVVNVATPPAFRVPCPSVVPSRNVTVPVGTLLPDCGATVAVNVTLCPGVTSAAEAVSVVVVAPVLAVTTKLNAFETELLSSLPPK